jgi:hypothetical protein
MALTRETFSAADAQAVAESYRTAFGAAPEILHALTGDGAERLG